MALERILITVKTYPALSNKYDELVCTAGLREDGSWIRIYPIPFRKLETKRARAMQLGLFCGAEDPFKVVKKLPYKFSYVFKEKQVYKNEPK